jgi:hypothetical protein
VAQIGTEALPQARKLARLVVTLQGNDKKRIIYHLFTWGYEEKLEASLLALKLS